MTIAWILLIIVALILGAGIVGNFLWACSLTNRELELDKYEVSLQEREHKLKETFLELCKDDDDVYKL